MDQHPRKEEESDGNSFVRRVKSFLFRLREVYTNLRGVYFTEDEVRYLIDIVDVWIEGHKDIEPADDELEDVYENFAVAVDVRNKLWKQLNE